MTFDIYWLLTFHESWHFMTFDIWHFMTFDISWLLTFHDFWHFMTFDISWHLTFDRHFMPFDISCHLTFHDIWHFMIFDISLHLTFYDICYFISFYISWHFTFYIYCEFCFRILALSSHFRPLSTSVTPHLFSTIWRSRPYKPNIFWKLMTPTIHWPTKHSPITLSDPPDPPKPCPTRPFIHNIAF